MPSRLEYVPILHLYNDDTDGPKINSEGNAVVLTLDLKEALSARPQTGVEVHFLPRGTSANNYVGDPRVGRYHVFYDMSALYSVIALITSRNTLFYCDSEDPKISGFTQPSMTEKAGPHHALTRKSPEVKPLRKKRE
jgi:hypothetical protein